MNDVQRRMAEGHAAEDGAGRSPFLVEPGWLQEHLEDDGIRLVHVDVSAESYARAHIPGAVLWNVYTDLRGPDFQLVGRTAVEHLVRASGIEPESRVVFTGYAPALGLWLLQAHGHSNLGLLDCSLDAWQAQSRPVSNVAPSPTATAYTLGEANPALRARREDVERAIGDPSTRILDVRSEAEYRGERFWPSGGQQEGGRAGHVPTAVNMPINGLLDDLGSFRDASALADAVRAADQTGPAGLITYCTIGGRAATVWFVLTHLLGRSGVRVYDGSWAEWGLASTTPVESA